MTCRICDGFFGRCERNSIYCKWCYDLLNHENTVEDNYGTAKKMYEIVKNRDPNNADWEPYSRHMHTSAFLYDRVIELQTVLRQAFPHHTYKEIKAIGKQLMEKANQ